MQARKMCVVVLICLAGGCVSYPGAIDRQLEKENAAIAAQVENAQ